MSETGEKIPLLSGFIINIPKEKSEKKCSSCLTYEEILVYETDPFWMSFRQIFFYSFWIVIISLVISASIISHNQMGTCTKLNSTVAMIPEPPKELLAVVSNIGTSQLRPVNLSSYLEDFVLRNDDVQSAGSLNLTSSIRK